MPSTYNIIGLMSGTSLDGLDIAYCRFTLLDNVNDISFEILAAETIEYTDDWKKVFVGLEKATGVDFCEADRKIGAWFGAQVNGFVKRHAINTVDLVASHGHTIFHQPEKGFTVQVGHGASLAAHAELPVACDFRSLDVALGGQGAPLVPIGDQILFKDFTFCLNLGGIANISYHDNGRTVAFDICPVNMVLNFFAEKLGLAYDAGGEVAAANQVDMALLDTLNALAFYKQPAPKSLGKEWVVSQFLPIVAQSGVAPQVALATLSEHIVEQISQVIKQTEMRPNASLLATGGGVFNDFLIKKLQKKLSGICDVIIPDEKTVKYKEALIFALLGLLRLKNSPNCLQSVTGATKDNIGGAIYCY